MAYEGISIGERADYLVRQISTDSCLDESRDGNARHYSRHGKHSENVRLRDHLLCCVKETAIYMTYTSKTIKQQKTKQKI